MMQKIAGFLDYRNKNFSKELFHICHLDGVSVGFSKNCEVLKFGYLQIVFKGDIYNKEEFKRRLLLYGYDFENESDGEIALKAVHKWGEKVLSEFDGDFQIAILNILENKFFLFRDKMGIMPLYYYEGDGFLIFSDSLKDIIYFNEFNKVISKEALSLYMSFGYILEPFTIWQNTYRIKAGFFLEFDLKKRIFFQRRYFDIAHIYRMPCLDMSEEEIKKEAQNLLIDSVLKRSQKATYVGILLSGGYDSSVIAALYAKYFERPVYTITIGFEEEDCDESVYAKSISKAIGSFHHEFIFSKKAMRDTILDFMKAYEEPFGDKASFGTLYALKLVKDEIDTVAAGDGGDEVFGTGDDIEKFRFFNRLPYSVRRKFAKTFNLLSPEEIVNKNRFKNIFTKIEKLQNILQSNGISQMLKHKSQILSFKEVKEILRDCCDYLPFTNFDQKMLEESNDELNNLLATTIKTYLIDDEIVKTQRASSYFNLSLKEIYLDQSLLEFMGRVKADIKQKNGIKKYILKEIAYKYIPRELLEREKHGFSFPLERWFRGDLKDLFLDYISKERLEREDVFDSKKILKMRDDFFRGNDEKIVALWNIFSFELWYEEWMEKRF